MYQQTSIIIKSSLERAWQILQKVMTTKDTPQIFKDCKEIEIKSEIDGQIKRRMHYTDRMEDEINTVHFQSYRINSSISDNNYIGEISYHLLKPTEIFLAEKHCSLVIISSWRMHPGVFAAPSIDKQDYIKYFAKHFEKLI